MNHKCAQCGNRADVVEQGTFYKCAQCWLQWMDQYLPKKENKDEQKTIHRTPIR